ncbi:MAG: hypothetical protein EPO06_11665 [Burkholderiaceae bacterium]|nr:MAG: hypothetical protein EPO06_11665 [Burkholderiaceae bacterium]
MIDGRDGHRYIGASDVQYETGYGDVTPAMLRGWADVEYLHRVTVAELAAALGEPVPVGVDGDAPARIHVRGRHVNVYRWADVVACERARRIAPAGRRRRRDP